MDVGFGRTVVKQRRPSTEPAGETLNPLLRLRSQKEKTVSTILSFLFIERKTGFEPATLALARRYSTTEPLAHGALFPSSKEYYTL